MTILVNAATGNVGRVVVRALAERGVAVRAVTRHPDYARRILGSKVEIVTADADRPSALLASLRGIERVFLASANHPDQVAAECLAIDACVASGVERIVKLSGPAPNLSSELLPDRWHAEIEDHLFNSGLPAVVLRPAPFMTNVLALAEPVNRFGTLPAPTSGAHVAFVDPGDVGEVGAAMLMRDAVRDPILALTGPTTVTYQDVAASISELTGRRVDFAAVTDEEAAAAMRDAEVPDAHIDIVLSVYRLQRNGAFDGVTDTVERVLGRPATSLRTFILNNRQLFTSEVRFG